MTTKRINPHEPEFLRQKQRNRKVHLVGVKQIAWKDPECQLHVPNPFDVLFPEDRTLDAVDFAELEALCSCRWEAAEPLPKNPKPRKQRLCKRCRMYRAVNGACEC